MYAFIKKNPIIIKFDIKYYAYKLRKRGVAYEYC